MRADGLSGTEAVCGEGRVIPSTGDDGGFSGMCLSSVSIELAESETSDYDEKMAKILSRGRVAAEPEGDSMMDATS